MEGDEVERMTFKSNEFLTPHTMKSSLPPQNKEERWNSGSPQEIRVEATVFDSEIEGERLRRPRSREMG